MKLKAYAFRDVKAESFDAPMFLPSDVAAQRITMDILQHPSSPIAKYPDDFLLYRIGDFDTDTAVMTSVSPVELVCSVRSCLPKPDPRQVTVDEVLNREEVDA